MKTLKSRCAFSGFSPFQCFSGSTAPIAAGEFTIGEFAEAAGGCCATASRRLAEMAEERKLLRRKVWSEEGREVWGFRLVRGEGKQMV